MKGTFAFVNTSDPAGAQRAREALNGTLIGGMPIRINNATRKARDNNMNQYGEAPPVSLPVPSFLGPTPGGFGPPATVVPPPVAPGMPAPVLPTVHPNVDSVRDDRGNPATKNLFIAGMLNLRYEQAGILKSVMPGWTLKLSFCPTLFC